MQTKKICYELCKQMGTKCKKTECRYSIKMPKYANCVLIAADQKHTLQDIGDVYGVTRMRICQIEKRALAKLDDLADHFK